MKTKINTPFFFRAPTNVPGICLSGGAALGFAHIGVLQSLEDHGIYPQHIVGTSMGAIVGTLYAAGYAPKDMLEIIDAQRLFKISRLMTIRPTHLTSGLSNHTMLRDLIKELVPHNSFEQLQKKMYICVANLNKAQWEIIDGGNELDKWVAASSSIPGLFEAMTHKKMFYVDGALLNNMPAQALEGICHTIIGVDVIPHVMPTKFNKPIDAVMSGVRVLQHQNSLEGRNLCRLIIEPRGIEFYHEFSFDSFRKIYQLGYDAATLALNENARI